MKHKINPPSFRLAGLRRARKYIYLINDVTSLILKKERIKDQEMALKLRHALIIASIILVISISLNIYLLLK
jgi:hypothetical protein